MMRHTLKRYLTLVSALVIACGSITYGQTVSKVPARILAAVNLTELTQLHGNATLAKAASADLGAIDGSTQLSHMLLLLEPSDAQKQDLNQLTAAQIDPKSPYFHKWLTPDEFGTRFGVAQEDIDKITAWLGTEGFTVDEVAVNHRVIQFSGTASQVASAFHTSLHRYQMSQSVHIANDADPQVPSALAPTIHGLVSLNDSERKPMHHSYGTFQLNQQTGALTPVAVQSDATAPVSQSASSDAHTETSVTIGSTIYHAVSPYDFAAMYDLKPLWTQGFDGTGQSIAILSPSDLNLSDVDSFRAQFGLPATHVTKVYAGTNPGITSNVDETALDVEWSGAVAKGANIDLVIGGTTLTTQGIDVAALYAVNNNIAPVISLSYGECEFYLGASGNAFYNTLWQQAAAQGQSVFISSGDAGASTCEQGSYVAALGMTVNGLGSTPYNVSVGGTDLYGTYSGTSTYWNTTNDSTTMASALGYIPEIPWNDSCGNPVLLSVLQTKKGYTDASTAALCGDTAKVTTSNYRNLVGGGGGASNCISTSDGTVNGCTGGYTKPSWQVGNGVPADGVRDLPDVSLFSGDGLWGSFYLYCYSYGTSTQTCNLTNSANVQGAGGTSFASPAFAGIMAIINQKAGTAQGNPNPVFYALASTQSALDCSSTNASASSSCIFHDVQVGSNAGACYKNSTGTRNCNFSSTSNTYGVVSGNSATAGYDLAIGLGSVDITNLVNNWSAVSLARNTTTTTLTLSSKTLTYGSSQTATIAVASANGTPTGDVSIQPSSTTTDAYITSPGTLSSGTSTIGLNLLPVGSYTLHAHYAGDTNYLASDSASQSITVAQAASTLSATPTRTTVQAGQTSMLQMIVSTSGSGLAPTGTVHIVDTTTGSDLGTYTLSASSSTVSANYNLSIAPAFLLGGTNTITIAYSGDSKYAASSATTTITFAAPMSLTLASSSLSLTTGTSANSVNTVLSVAAANGGSLNYPIALTCSGTLPNGASCNLSNAILASPTTSATVTIGFTPPVTDAKLEDFHHGFTATPFVALGFGVLLLVGRKRKIFASLSMLLAIGAGLMTLNACSSSMAVTTAVNLTSSASSITQGSPLTLTSTVNYSNAGSSVQISPVQITDVFRGASHLLGSTTSTSTTATSSTGTLSTSALGIGTHSISATYTGNPGSISNTLTVSVTNTSNLTITAVDANGYTVTVPLGVTLL